MEEEMQSIEETVGLLDYTQEELFPLSDTQKNDIEHHKMKKDIATLRKSQFVRLGEILEQYKSTRDEVDQLRVLCENLQNEVRKLKDASIEDMSIHESMLRHLPAPKLIFS